MRRLVSLLTVVLALSLFVAGCEQQTTTEAPPTPKPEEDIPDLAGRRVIVGMAPNMPPLVFDSAEGIAGFDVELVRALADVAGFEPEPVRMPWEALPYALAAGDVDLVVSALSLDTELPEGLAFVGPYLDAGPVVVVPCITDDITGPADLANRYTGVLTGTSIDDLTEEVLDADDIGVYPNPGHLFDALQHGDIEAAIADLAVAANLVAQHDGMVQIVGQRVGEKPLGIAVRQSDSELLDGVDYALGVLRETGQLDVLEDRWFRYVPLSMQLLEIAANPDTYLDQEVELQGYFAESLVPYLLADYQDTLMETPLPKDRILLLTGNVPGEDLEGYRLRVWGTLEPYAVQYPEVQQAPAVLNVEGYEPVCAAHRPAVEVARPQLASAAGMLSMTQSDGSLQAVALQPRNQLAILISGDDGDGHRRYWNDLMFIYNMLTARYGLGADDIYVLYRDGTPIRRKDHLLPGTFPAPRLPNLGGLRAADMTSVNQVFTDVANRVNANTTLYIFTTNHGAKRLGLCLWQSDRLTPHDLERHIRNLRARGLRDIHVVMGQCYSGMFINPLKGIVTTIATASPGHCTSWAADTEGKYDEFLYHCVSALNRATPGGTRVDADANGDGTVSFTEAFYYARWKCSTPDKPQSAARKTRVAAPDYQVAVSSWKVKRSFLYSDVWEWSYVVKNNSAAVAPSARDIIGFKIVFPSGYKVSDWVLTESNTTDQKGGTLHKNGGHMTIPEGWSWEINGNELIFKTSGTQSWGSPITPTSPRHARTFKFHTELDHSLGGTVQVEVSRNRGTGGWGFFAGGTVISVEGPVK